MTKGPTDRTTDHSTECVDIGRDLCYAERCGLNYFADGVQKLVYLILCSVSALLFTPALVVISAFEVWLVWQHFTSPVYIVCKLTTACDERVRPSV